MNSLAVRVLIALTLGLGLGAALNQGGAVPGWLASSSEAIGSLWLGFLQMTVIPLVFALLVVGVAAVSNALSAGKLTARALALFTVLLTAAIGLTFLGVGGALTAFPVEAASARVLVEGATGGDVPTQQAIEFGAWLKSLAPSNPVAAAAGNAVLPLVIFALFFAFAVTQLPAAQRAFLVQLFESIAAAMVIIVKWVLLAAPLGVFALALTLGLRSGLGATGALFHYVVLVSASCVAVVIACYPLAALFGRMSPLRFAPAIAPAQVVAFSTQSSLGTLPVMVEIARRSLGVPEHVAGLILPLAVAVFRLTSPVANLAVVLFICHVSGIEPALPQMIAAGLVAFAVSISSVGLSVQVSFFVSVAPICFALGAPIDLLPLLLAVEVIPDIFRTVGNVTADLTVTAILGREEDGEKDPV